MFPSYLFFLPTSAEEFQVKSLHLMLLELVAGVVLLLVICCVVAILTKDNLRATIFPLWIPFLLPVVCLVAVVYCRNRWRRQFGRMEINGLIIANGVLIGRAVIDVTFFYDVDGVVLVALRLLEILIWICVLARFFRRSMLLQRR
jgi:hypothetical protein